MPSRRLVLAALAAALAPAAARAEPFAYRGWSIATDGLDGPLPAPLQASLRAQLDIVEAVRITPAIKAFFHSVPLTLVPESHGGAGDYSFDLHRVRLAAKVDPPENPVLLHELLHAYHDQRLGRLNPTLRGFYAEAQASGDWPAQAYMVKNPAEFFAMCASVVLWGRAARPPFTREAVRTKAPRLYAWIVQEFGLEVA